MILYMLQLPKLLLTITPFLIPTAFSALLPNLTYPSPTPSLTCHHPTATRSISYNDCRQALSLFRSKHENSPLYALSHMRDPPGETRFIVCPYTLRLGTCTLWLDYKDLQAYYPLVEIEFVVRFGNRLARSCVRDGEGAGGWVVPLDMAGWGKAVLRLQYS